MEKPLLEKTLIEKKFNVFIADIKGKILSSDLIKKPFALILSKESSGPNLWPSSFQKITIPTSNKVDSLNVAIAGGILMHSFKKNLQV